MTYLKEGTDKISVLHVNTSSILGVRYPLTVFQTGVHMLPQVQFCYSASPIEGNVVPLQHTQCIPACTSMCKHAHTHARMHWILHGSKIQS